MFNFKRKAMPFMICISLVFAVSCQSTQRSGSRDRLSEAHEKASQNRILTNQIASIRAEMREAQKSGDYYAASDLRKELRDAQAKLTANGGNLPEDQDMYYTNNSRNSSSVDLLERTNANSTYANGELTTSSRMLRAAQ